MNFGIKSHGKHSVIKLNCRISDHDVNLITDIFPDLVAFTTYKGLKRIEGCLSIQDTDEFRTWIKSSILRYKINTLECELRDVLQPEQSDIPF
jgi:hypothetical protein